MFRAVSIIGGLLVVGGFLFSFFSVERGAGIPAGTIGLFVSVFGGLVEFFLGGDAKRNGEKK